MNEALELAGLLNNKDNDPLKELKLRRGSVTAVAASSATVTIGGASLASIPFYEHAVPQVNDVVDVLFDGPAPRIIGVIGSAPQFVTPSAFTNGWVQFDSVNYPVGYTRTSENVVMLRGLIKSGTLGQIAFALPAGYRPASEVIAAAACHDGVSSRFGDLRITTGGNVLPYAGGNTWFSLDGVSFIAS